MATMSQWFNYQNKLARNIKMSHAERLDFMPIKRTVRQFFGIPVITTWERRGYKLFSRQGRDFYFIYDEKLEASYR